MLVLNPDPPEQSRVPKSRNVPEWPQPSGSSSVCEKWFAIKLSLSILLWKNVRPALSDGLSRHVYCAPRKISVSNCLSLNERAVKTGWLEFLWVSEWKEAGLRWLVMEWKWVWNRERGSGVRTFWSKHKLYFHQYGLVLRTYTMTAIISSP